MGDGGGNSSPLQQVTDVGLGVMTGGLYTAGKAGVDYVDQQKKKAKEMQNKMDDAIDEQKRAAGDARNKLEGQQAEANAQTAMGNERNAALRLKKNRRGGDQGRSGTILTGLGDGPAPGAENNKTLLGV